METSQNQTCSACKGPYHPALGHAFTETLHLCLRCTQSFIRWLKLREGNMGRIVEPGIPSFTQAALTSIKADKE